MLPKEQVTSNPFTLLAATRRGGHLAFLQGWWPLGASYCDEVIDDWLGSTLQEWRHGCDPLLPRLDAAANAANQGLFSGLAAAGSSSSRWSYSPGQSTAAAAAGLGHDVPSWVDRAVHGGWQPQQFDPSSLASIMCSCSPDADPLGRAQAADAVLNAATAPAQLAAAAAGKAAGGAKQAWTFGFGTGRGGSDAGSVNGLRGDGAWAPFQDSSSSGNRRWDSATAAAAVNGFDAADAEYAGEVEVVSSAEGAGIGRQPASGAPHQHQQQKHLQQRLWRSKL
jgi:hypothetical protein